MTQEGVIQAEIMKALGSIPSIRLWRNNVGMFQDKTGKWVKYGVANPGGSDLLGWIKCRGNSYSTFFAIEAKTPKGRMSPEQENFQRVVNLHRGIAIVARSAEDALKQIAPYI
jgi:hypothetical protein